MRLHVRGDARYSRPSCRQIFWRNCRQETGNIIRLRSAVVCYIGISGKLYKTVTEISDAVVGYVRPQCIVALDITSIPNFFFFLCMPEH